MTTEESLNRLKEGNARFVADQLDRKLKYDTIRVGLINEQQPFAVILGCSDSRIVPELMFDASLGEIFVVRVAGNVANTSSIASIEYAVSHLNTKLVVVLGHQNCGAVTAAVAGGSYGQNIKHLLSHIHPAIYALKKGSSINKIAKKNVELTIEELKSKSKIIKNAVNNGDTKIVAAYYRLDTGKVDFF